MAFGSEHVDKTNGSKKIALFTCTHEIFELLRVTTPTTDPSHSSRSCSRSRLMRLGRRGLGMGKLGKTMPKMTTPGSTCISNISIYFKFVFQFFRWCFSGICHVPSKMAAEAVAYIDRSQPIHQPITWYSYIYRWHRFTHGDALCHCPIPARHGRLWHLRLVGDHHLHGQVHKLHPYVLQHRSRVIMSMYACIQQGAHNMHASCIYYSHIIYAILPEGQGECELVWRKHGCVVIMHIVCIY